MWIWCYICSSIIFWFFNAISLKVKPRLFWSSWIGRDFFSFKFLWLSFDWFLFWNPRCFLLILVIFVDFLSLESSVCLGFNLSKQWSWILNPWVNSSLIRGVTVEKYFSLRSSILNTVICWVTMFLFADLSL